MLCGSQSFSTFENVTLAALTSWHACILASRTTHKSHLGRFIYPWWSLAILCQDAGAKPTLIALTRCCCIVLWVNWINYSFPLWGCCWCKSIPFQDVQTVSRCIMLQNSSNWISPSPFSSISAINLLSSSPSSSEMPSAFLISSGEIEPFPSLSKRRKAARSFCYEIRSLSFIVAITNSV